MDVPIQVNTPVRVLPGAEHAAGGVDEAARGVGLLAGVVQGDLDDAAGVPGEIDGGTNGDPLPSVLVLDAEKLGFARTAVGVFLIVAVPVLLGLLVRRFREGFARRAEPIARRISTVLFVLVLAGAIYQERDNIVTYFGQAGTVTLALNLVMMALAYGVAQLLASGVRQRIAISIECGLQNGTLAIAIAALLFGGGLVAVPAATYSVIMFGTALIFIAALRALVRNRPAPADAA